LSVSPSDNKAISPISNQIFYKIYANAGIIIDDAWTAYSMQRKVYGTAGRPSVCPIDPQQQRRTAGLLLSALWAGDIDR